MDRRIGELERLTRLRDAGTLSAAEFEREKARVMHEPGDISWLPVASWFPRRYIKTALIAVAVFCVVALGAGVVIYRSGAVPPPPAPPVPTTSHLDPGEISRPDWRSRLSGTADETVTLGASCEPGARRDFARKRELPADLQAALSDYDMDMAEAGADFQATDDLSGPPLPSRRFMSARQEGCTVTLKYEQGGIAHTYQTAVFTFANGEWAKTS